MENNKAPFEVGITTVPQVNPEAPKVISQGPSVCLFQSENPQEIYASWLFVKFLTTEVQFQAEFSMASGYVPVIKSVSEDPVYSDFLEAADGYETGIAALSAKVCLEQKDAYYVSPAFRGSSKARDEVGTLMQVCLSAYAEAVDKMAMIKEKFDEAIEECEY
jgi:multiple sugar transport system substrate-binding protein